MTSPTSTIGYVSRWFPIANAVVARSCCARCEQIVQPRSDRRLGPREFPQKTAGRRDRLCRLARADHRGVRSPAHPKTSRTPPSACFRFRRTVTTSAPVAKANAAASLADRGLRPVSRPNRAIQAPLPITASEPSAHPDPRSRDRLDLHKTTEFYSTNPRSHAAQAIEPRARRSPPTNPIAERAQRPAEEPCKLTFQIT
jgi:hypothetical protein